MSDDIDVQLFRDDGLWVKPPGALTVMTRAEALKARAGRAHGDGK